MTLTWIAQRLRMGGRTRTANLIYEKTATHIGIQQGYCSVFLIRPSSASDTHSIFSSIG